MQTNPINFCENILIDCKKYNVENNILPSHNLIVDLLIERRSEIIDAHKELYNKLSSSPKAIEVFFDALLGTAAFWNPNKLKVARSERAQLVDLNEKIAITAKQLGLLLDRRSALNNKSAFFSDNIGNICDVILHAATHNHLFNWSVRDELVRLAGQFDQKYWPTLSEVIFSLSADAEQASVIPGNPVTAAATDALRHSLSDYLRALFLAIEERKRPNNGFLPADFRLSDEAYASLTNVVLDLRESDLIDSSYVKRMRQRDRAKK